MILFIDDEPRIMHGYFAYLEREMQQYGHDVQFVSNVDDALDLFDNRRPEIDLIILDIMMPPGERFSSDETNEGLQTGVVFYKRIRNHLPDLPVLIFSNYYDEDLDNDLRQDVNCRFLQKADYLLDEFVAEVKKLLLL